MDLWTPKRHPGKNLSCVIVCTSSEVAGIVDVEGAPVISVHGAYGGSSARGGSVTTDYTGLPDPAPEGWHLMQEGPKSGFRDDARFLSGRHVLHQAISLAVHLGFSNIRIQAPDPEPRLRRSLDSLVRPLRHKRVHVVGCAPFPTE